MSNIPTIDESFPVEYLFLFKEGDKLTAERVSSLGSGIHGRSFDKELAYDEYLKRFDRPLSKNEEPFHIKGPIYNGKMLKPIKGGTFDRASMFFSGERFKCQYNKWNGIAHVVNDKAGREAAFFFSISYDSTDPFVKKARPKPKIVNISSLN